MQLIEEALLSAPIAIMWKDREGRYLGMNSQALSMFGFKEKDILGKTDYDLFPKDLADHYREVDQRIMSSQKAEYFLEKAKDQSGNIIEVFAGKKPLWSRDKQVIGIVLFTVPRDQVPF